MIIEGYLNSIVNKIDFLIHDSNISCLNRKVDFKIPAVLLTSSLSDV